MAKQFKLNVEKRESTGKLGVKEFFSGPETLSALNESKRRKSMLGLIILLSDGANNKQIMGKYLKLVFD